MTRDEAIELWLEASNTHANVYHEVEQGDPLAALSQAALNKATEAAATVIQQAFAERDGEIEQDAARYRWLRDESCPPHNFYVSVPDEFKGVRYSRADVDAYIDEARQALAAKGDSRG